jgi:hypothetical protein
VSASRPEASLRAQQLWFAGAVMRSETDPVQIGAAEAEKLLTSGPRLSALERLEIYRRGYVARLIECLADDYPALQQALGKEAFAELCRAYIAAHPSEQPSLNFYGARMADFCRASAANDHSAPSPRSPLNVPSHFAADLAALEWAMVEVIHAASAPPLLLDGLRDVPADAWGDARLFANTAMRILRFGYPVNAYLQAFRDGNDVQVPQPLRCATVVWRSGPRVWRMDLTEPMHDVLSALVAGDSLGAALERAADASSGDSDEALAARVMAWFREWVQGGLFARVEFTA